ncbi:MAG: flagellar protein FliS [Caldiserica bacterium]|nr:flagellar protein FliS [Caldisericota bacterium]
MYQQAYRNQTYRQNDVLGASPLRLVVMAYDLAIQSCERKDFEKATRAISVLRDALNFEYQDVALGLFRVYQWCLDSIRQGDYNSAISALSELRSAWVQTEKKITPVMNTSVQQTRVAIETPA